MHLTLDDVPAVRFVRSLCLMCASCLRVCVQPGGSVLEPAAPHAGLCRGVWEGRQRYRVWRGTLPVEVAGVDNRGHTAFLCCEALIPVTYLPLAALLRADNGPAEAQGAALVAGDALAL